MPNAYTDTPIASHILANDQPTMEANFLYVANTLGQSAKAGDHQIGLDTIGTPHNDSITFEGRHVQVCLNNRSGSSPTVAGISDGVNSLIYSSNGNLFFDSANLAGPYQLTTANATLPIARFGANGTYIITGKTINNAGWTFLPGGLIMAYGNFDPNSFTNVPFPITFPTACFQVQLTGAADNNSTFRNGISTGTITTSGFSWEGTISSHWTPIYFMAIGK